MNIDDFKKLTAEFPCAEGLTNIQSCGALAISADGFSLQKYTYYADGRLYIADRTQSGWELHGGESLHESVSSLALLIGDTPLSRTQFIHELLPDEAFCLAALMDLHGRAVLQAAAHADSRAGMSTANVREALEAPEENGIADILRTYCKATKTDTPQALASLLSKGLCTLRDGQYLLNDELAALASALALPTASAAFRTWKHRGNHVSAAASFVLQGSLHDILMAAVGAKSVIFCSLSAAALLDFIETTLSFRAEDRAQGTAPTSGVWRCVCGRENAGAFCPQCGAKRP